MSTIYRRFGFAPRLGIFSVRWRKKLYFLRAPWWTPLYSERRGNDRIIPLGRGWRITIRSIEP